MRDVFRARRWLVVVLLLASIGASCLDRPVSLTPRSSGLTQAAASDFFYVATALGAGTPTGMNNLGEVAGTDPAGGFLWRPDTGRTALGLRSVGGVNDNGQVAGSLGPYPFLAAIWDNGTAFPLDTLGGDTSEAMDINNAGLAVGVADGPPVTCWHRWPTSYAFLWDGAMHSLGTFPNRPTSCSASDNVSPATSWALAISNNGLVVGFGYLETETTRSARPMLVHNGQVIDLGTILGDLRFSGQARDVNDAGQIVGYSEVGANPDEWWTFTQRATLWDGSIRDLGTLGGLSSVAHSINSRGDVVGEAQTPAGDHHAFLWQDGAMIDLNSLLAPNSGLVLESATAINDLGQIAGTGTNGGVTTAFRLDPCTASIAGTSISGTVLDPEGRPAAGLYLSVGEQRAVTDSHGRYRFICLPPGSNTVVPVGYDPDFVPTPGRGYSFSPPERTVTLPPRQADQDFSFGCAVPGVQPYRQGGTTIWADQILDHHVLHKTMAQRGCAVTALAMVFSAYGYSYTPGDLNEELKTTAHFADANGNGVFDSEAYRSSASGALDSICPPGPQMADPVPDVDFVDWDDDGAWTPSEVSAAFSCSHDVSWTHVAATLAGARVQFKRAVDRNLDGDAGVRAAMAREVCEGRPVVLHVPSHSVASSWSPPQEFPKAGHFVVATGWTSSGFTINDPATGAMRPLSDYKNLVQSLRVFGPPGTGALMIRIDRALDFSLTDPAGRFFEKFDSSIYSEIPRAAFTDDHIEDLDAAASTEPSPGTSYLFIPKADEGAFSLEVFGPRGATVTLTVERFNVHDRAQLPEVRRLDLGSAGSASLELGYTKSPLDVDGSGVVDERDEALVRSALGKKAGQPGYNPFADANGDGIVNAIDLGDDSGGVADTDSDGLPDDADNCQSAANADQADLDADGAGDACDPDDDDDGVADAADTCPGTSARAPALANGCSVAQECGCSARWKNHGQYVSCVSKACTALVNAGRISSAEANATTSAAARSSCGKK
jgi:probable HAF family extracellular repeat protein